MINACFDCGAVREYPDGHPIDKCPRCKGGHIVYRPSPTTKAESDKAVLEAITGRRQ